MVSVRPATAEDARFVWEVNSHPSVRAESVRTDPIPWESHLAWYEKKLASDGCRMFVGEGEEGRVGVVRFDVQGDLAVISVAVAPDRRGRGVGTALIAQGTSHVLESIASVERVVAFVRPSNAASRRAFERAGYGFVSKDEQEGVALDRLEKRRSS